MSVNIILRDVCCSEISGRVPFYVDCCQIVYDVIICDFYRATVKLETEEEIMRVTEGEAHIHVLAIYTYTWLYTECYSDSVPRSKLWKYLVKKNSGATVFYSHLSAKLRHDMYENPLWYYLFLFKITLHFSVIEFIISHVLICKIIIIILKCYEIVKINN